ncbi:MAG: glutamate ABC transporter substrate-binding protein [Actinomycetes bacterium]
MGMRTIGMVLAAPLLAFGLTACGSDDGGETEANTDAKFKSGTTMAKLNEAGKVTIGIKIDQPGIGFMDPATQEPEGFDVEMGKYVAAELGIEEDDIEFKETVSDNREPFLQKGTVDLVLASYSIVPERRAIVGQAGPYYVTGQQLLVREEDKNKIKGPEDAKGIKVCSAEGSTSIETIEKEYGATPVPFATYTECVQQLKSGAVDAVTTDGAILLGYEADAPDELQVVGPEFSEERYGIGFKKGDDAMCTFLQDTIEKSYEDGTWEQAFEDTLGKSGVKTPEPPKVDANC